MAAAAAAQPAGEDWKQQLSLPAKDSRYKTEVRAAGQGGSRGPPGRPPDPMPTIRRPSLPRPAAAAPQDVTATKGNSFEDYFLKRYARAGCGPPAGTLPPPAAPRVGGRGLLPSPAESGVRGVLADVAPPPLSAPTLIVLLPSPPRPLVAAAAGSC